MGRFTGASLRKSFADVMRRKGRTLLVVPVDFVIDPAAFVVMLVAVVVIATLATIPPASHASRIRVADMLRYE